MEGDDSTQGSSTEGEVTPWHESALFWGCSGTALAVLLTALPAIIQDVRWLLFAALPPAVGAVWAFATIKRLKRKITWTSLSGIALVAAVLVVLYISHSPAEVSKSAPAELPVTGTDSQSSSDVTLHNLFIDDFRGGSYKLVLFHSTNLYRDGRRLGHYRFEFGMHGDFQAKSLFLSFFAPDSDNAYDLIRWFSGTYKDYLYDGRRRMRVWTASEGTTNQPISDDLVFTNKIYIYYENILTTQQLHALAGFYLDKGIEVEFRGFNYVEMRRTKGPKLSDQFYKKTDGSAQTRQLDTLTPPFTPDPSNEVQPNLLTLFMTDLTMEHGAVYVGRNKIDVRSDSSGATQEVNVTYVIYYIRSTHVIVASVYIPHSYYTGKIISYVFSEIRDRIKESNKKMAPMEQTASYKFDGKMYVYHEDDIESDVSASFLDSIARSHGIDAEYRGEDYLMMARFQISTNQRSVPPLYHMIDDSPILLPGQKLAHRPEATINFPDATQPTPPR